MQSTFGWALPRFALRRPVTIWMCVLASVAIGIIAYFRLPMQLLPSGFDYPFLYVRIPFPNSTPKEVEDQIVRPGERMFATLKGLYQLRTWASDQHGSFWMRFDGSVSMTVIYQQLRDRLERLMPTLPEGTERYYIWKWDPEAQPILYFGIAINTRVDDYYHTLEQHLFSQIRRLPGISKIDVVGLEQPYIRIEVDRRKAQAHRINIYSLIYQLRRDNLAVPSGEISHGPRQFYVRSDNRLTTIGDLQRYPVSPNVQLGDIADIKLIPNNAEQLFRINGKEGIFVEIHKESEANTVALTRQVRTLLARLLQDDPALAPFQLHYLSDQGEMIEKTIQQLQHALIWGGAFALVILFLFLQNLRMTLLVMLAIPLSLIVTIASLYFMGESLNMFSLVGLMLSVGMVVDNAIVVVENIARVRNEGADPIQASTQGSAEVALAVLMATSTTAVVFLPLILMSDSREFSFYMGKLGYPVTIALTASLLVALLVIPLGSSKFIGSKSPKKIRVFSYISESYSRILSWMLRHRFDTTLIALLLFSTILYPLGKIQRTHTARSRASQIRLGFNFSHNYTFAQKQQYLLSVEKQLEKYKTEWGVLNITTRLQNQSVSARVDLFLDVNTPLEHDHQTLSPLLMQVLPDAPGVERRIGWRRMRSGDDTIELQLYGPDSQTLEQIAKRLEHYLKRDPAFAKAEAEIREESVPELQLHILRHWAFRYELPANIVGSNVAYALSGRRMRNIQDQERSFQVWLTYKADDRDNLQQLKQLGIANWQSAQQIPLEQLVSSKFARSPQVINRVNRQTYLSINISTSSQDLMRLYGRLDHIMQDFPMPAGYTWGKGFRFRDMQDSDASRQFALILSITFVFLLMGILFESFSLPFSVILAIPLAFLGSYWLLYLTDTPFGIMSGIGMVMLVGIVVNHAIVLIDRINQLRQLGLPREQAILEAAAQRIRPILMTTITTIFGLLPMAMGGATVIGIPYAPLGRTVIGGLATSAFLSLLIVPIFYTFIDDLREAVLKRLAIQHTTYNKHHKPCYTNAPHKTNTQ
jgi:HAE1 family hydrophobic/amphiphilic exporter-1